MHDTRNAHWAGLAEPDRSTSDTADVASAGRIEDQGTRDDEDSAATAAIAEADKAFLTLRAMLALKGHVLSRTRGDDGPVRFYVTRWGLVRELPCIAAVRVFAEQVGATHA